MCRPEHFNKEQCKIKRYWKNKKNLTIAYRTLRAREATDSELNQTTNYNSIHFAARALNISHSIIVKYFSRNQQKPYKGRYTFKKL